ncbi:YihY family inner membrane protein [Actimicrobium sp. CCI2.3]|uniref:YihY family inner membrane protein n=1 Tax=Actimicrobium sp. CCI2.3 TaxID=3048616 RepID=UPI002AB549C0|nr:YihY family inner membrane protein [Actimicrobium sp. CCI2.3]MDY7575274.1 YihY family inner membrane protein [Actimicrobium sp. CCI2.3]MEB0023137.1 YihY family inner membrane protein [Actimicrobium sp. CCI2.3]
MILALRFSLLRGLTWARLRDLFRFAARRLDEEHLPQVAGSLTFTTVLALVPLLTIALAIFTAFPLFNTFRTSLEAYFTQNLMPRAIANTVLEYLTQFAAKSTGLSAIGGGVLIVTAVAMMSTIDRVFNRIWHVRVSRPFLQRVLVYWAIVTLGPLLIGVSISLTSYLFKATNGAVLTIPLIGAVAYTIISVALTTGAFALLYVSVPNRAVAWPDALWGGLLAGVAFEIAKRLFATYVVRFPTYTMVYGSVAAVPIFLLWIYMFWMITLGGALLAAALPVVKYERWWHVARPGSAFVDAIDILRMLYRARSVGDSAEVNATMIRNGTHLGFDESEQLLQQMLDAGWVGRIRNEEPKRRLRWGKSDNGSLDRWTLLANPQQLKLGDVYQVFVFDAFSASPLATHVESAIERGLDQSLAAYFDHEPVRPFKLTAATESGGL